MKIVPRFGSKKPAANAKATPQPSSTATTPMIESRDTRGRTELHKAIIADNPMQVRNALIHGANPNTRDNVGREGFTPLYYAACEKRRLEYVRMLQAAGAKLDMATATELQRQAAAEPLNKQLRDIRTALQL